MYLNARHEDLKLRELAVLTKLEKSIKVDKRTVLGHTAPQRSQTPNWGYGSISTPSRHVPQARAISPPSWSSAPQSATVKLKKQ